MPQQLIQFIINHWPLAAAFAVLLLLIIVNEYINQRHGAPKLSTAAAVVQINHHSAVVIDIRPKSAFQTQHIIGAVSIPSDDPEQFKAYQSCPCILVCARGLQSSVLAAQLLKRGFSKPMVLDGGMQAWLAANLPLVNDKSKRHQGK